jgi:hypothetical protein
MTLSEKAIFLGLVGCAILGVAEYFHHLFKHNR